MKDLTGKVNGYGCQRCGRSVYFRHVHHGTTPMFMGCKATEGCKGTMASMMYRVPPEADYFVTYEWFKPESLAGYSAEMKDHIRRGGLDYRPIQVEQKDSDG